MTNECPKCQTHNTEDSQFCKKCATPLTGIEEVVHTKTLEIPTGELTTGSTDTKINEKIALKLIKPEIATDKKTIERFSNEIKIARKIGHRHVGRMFHLGEEQGTHFITMEYVPGEDLRSMIRMSGQLGIGEPGTIVQQMSWRHAFGGLEHLWIEDDRNQPAVEN